MNLYYLQQDERDDWDTYDSMVVCAENEEKAKEIHPDGTWEFNDTWASKPENVKCTYIGVAANSVKEGIVCASFNAG